MKIIFVIVLLISVASSNNWQLISDCDRIVSQGVTACVQSFSPIKFVGDVITANKDSLCCTHFKHDACIKAVRDAVRIATASKLCTDSIADGVISTLTDSSINDFVSESCKSFNTQKCIMDSVNGVVNTVKGFFESVIPQQTPAFRSAIDGILNPNPKRVSPSVINPFQDSVPSTESPISGVINGFRQYIPDASVLNPVVQLVNGRKQTKLENSGEDSFKSFFDGLLNTDSTNKPSDDSNIFNDNDKNPSKIFESFGDLFRINRNNSSSLVKSLTGSIF